MSSMRVVEMREKWTELKEREDLSEEAFIKDRDVLNTFHKDTGKELTLPMLQAYTLEYEHMNSITSENNNQSSV